MPFWLVFPLEETAELLNVSARTVIRDWNLLAPGSIDSSIPNGPPDVGRDRLKQHFAEATPCGEERAALIGVLRSEDPISPRTPLTAHGPRQRSSFLAHDFDSYCPVTDRGL